MPPATLLHLAKARRALRRALRLASTERHAALAAAKTSAETYRQLAARNPHVINEYAASLQTLAELQLAAADLPTALRSLDLLVDVLNVSHQSTQLPPGSDLLADALTRRGDTHRLAAEYARAEEDLDHAMLIAGSLPVQAGVHNALGILAKDNGRYAEAAEHYQQALRILQRELGPDHANLASIFHNLAGLEHAQGRYQTGEPLARHALALRGTRAATNSAEVTADLAVLGAMLSGQHRYDEAEAIFRRTLTTWTDLRGPDHYEVAVSLQHLAALHVAQGNFPEARDEYRNALRIKRLSLRDEHPEVVALIADVAATARL